MTDAERDVPVLVVGGGPVGLSLAAELGYHGVRCLLVERNPDINNHPRANVVSARSMEHFRRWGIARAVEDGGLPRDYPVEIVFTTRVATGEFFRFSFPSIDDADHPTPELLAAMPELRLSPYFKTSIGQNHLERVIRRHVETLPGVELRFGWQLESFEDRGDRVRATIADTASGATETLDVGYLAGCDGGRSTVRRGLGIQLTGRGELGRFVSIHFRSEAFGHRHASGRATLYWALNGDSNGCFIAIDGKDHFTFQRELGDHEDAASIDAQAAIDQAFGEALPCEILSVQPWTAQQLVAETYQRGRVFLAGDAAHLFVPTGGFGMNTGIGDAIDLGWKLAATVDGWGGPALLESYTAERRPIGVRNTTEAADNYEKIKPAFALGKDAASAGPVGVRARETLAAELATGRKHFAAMGIHLGYRYEDSPVVVPDGSPATPDDPQRYVPTARPGSRAPHAWLGDGRSILDLFGHGFVLLRLGAPRLAVDGLVRAASDAGLPLAVVDLDDPRIAELYDAALVLVRPDGHVAWRGSQPPADPAAILGIVTGRHTHNVEPPAAVVA